MATVVPEGFSRGRADFDLGYRRAQAVNQRLFFQRNGSHVRRYAWEEGGARGIPGDFVEIHPQPRAVLAEHARNPTEVKETVEGVWSEELKGISSSSGCGICLEDFSLEERVAVINCSDVKHVFHFDCLITDNMLKVNTCPNCRRGIKYISPEQRQVSEILDLIESCDESFVTGLKTVSDECLRNIYNFVIRDLEEFNFFINAILNDSVESQDGELFLRVFSIIMNNNDVSDFVRVISIDDESDNKVCIAVNCLKDNPTLLKGFFDSIMYSFELIPTLGIISQKPKLLTKVFRTLCDIGSNDDGSYPYSVHLMERIGRYHSGKLLFPFVLTLSKGKEEDLSYIFEKLMYNEYFINNFFHYLPSEENPGNFSNFLKKMLSSPLLVNKIFQELSNCKIVLNRTFNFLQTSPDQEIYERILGSLSRKTKVFIGSKLEGDFFNFFNSHQDLATKVLIKAYKHKKVIAAATSITTFVGGLIIFS